MGLAAALFCAPGPQVVQAQSYGSSSGYTPSDVRTYGSSGSSSSSSSRTTTSNTTSNQILNRGQNTANNQGGQNNRQGAGGGNRQGQQGAGNANTTNRTAAVKKGGYEKVVGNSSKKAKGRSLGEFKLTADTKAAVVYMDPADSTVAEGKEFTTSFELNNPASRGFDEIRVVIEYDRDFVKPLGVRDLGIRPMLAQKSRVQVFPKDGRIVYEAELKGEYAPINTSLFQLRWQALRKTERADFHVVGKGPNASGLFKGERDILGDEEIAGDGFIDGSVQIVSPEFLEQALKNKARTRPGDAIEEVAFSPDHEATEGGVVLALALPRRDITVGDVFPVDIVLDNSADSLLDNVMIVLRYDQDVLEAVDSDRDNWITRGINILDGPYHKAFPFDYHIANQVYPARGELIYRVGVSDPEKLRGRSGTLATVFFRAKEPTGRTEIEFRLPEMDGDTGTRIASGMTSVLGPKDDPARGAVGISFKIKD